MRITLSGDKISESFNVPATAMPHIIGFLRSMHELTIHPDPTPSMVRVLLTHCGQKKINVIKTLHSFYREHGFKLVDSKALADAAPTRLPALTPDRAMALQMSLRKDGAIVSGADAVDRLAEVLEG